MSRKYANSFCVCCHLSCVDICLCSEASPSCLWPGSLWLRALGAESREFLLRFVAFDDIQSVASDGSSVRLVFLVKSFRRARYTAWDRSSGKTPKAGVLFVDPLVVSLARARRGPMRGCRRNCYMYALGLLQ